MNPVGRPKGQADKRALLIDAARQLFSVRPYANVSTRQLAAHAGVNASLIRYYFQDKAGLFSAMIIETFDPILTHLKRPTAPDETAIAEMIPLYYQVMQQAPDIPKLLLRTLWDPHCAEYRLVAPVFQRLLDHLVPLFDGLLAQSNIAAPFSPQLVRISLMSLAIFPFLAPDMVLQRLGLSLDRAWLDTLGEQNKQLICHGLSLGEAQ